MRAALSSARRPLLGSWLLGRLCSTQALVAHKRGPELQGSAAVNWLRNQGRTPGCLIGDKLPQVPFWVEAEQLEARMRKPGFEARLIELVLEGQIIRALPAEIHRLGNARGAPPTHITLQRWPRDPEKNPVKRSIHTRVINELKCPQVKMGAYVHEIFNRDGIPVWLRDPYHIPETLIVDMARADGGDVRVEHLDLPPGVTVRPIKNLPENFLVARAKRIRG